MSFIIAKSETSLTCLIASPVQALMSVCWALSSCLSVRKVSGFLSEQVGKLFCWFNNAIPFYSAEYQHECAEKQGREMRYLGGRKLREKDRTATCSGSDLVARSVQLVCFTESAKCLILLFVVYGKFWFKYSPAFNYFLNPVYTFQAWVGICKRMQQIMFKVVALHVATWIIWVKKKYYSCFSLSPGGSKWKEKKSE